MSWIDLRKFILPVFAILLGLVTLRYLLLEGGSKEVSANMGSTGTTTFVYETVRGFFKQDEPDTKVKSFDYTEENFGLINRTYDTDGEGDDQLTQWQRFEKYIAHLVNTSPDNTIYKVIYVGRHGEGYHNVGEAKYGTKAWDDYWSKLDGDGELYWLDAHLTEIGKQQARNNNAFFQLQFRDAKMPSPQRYYVSPLYRCLQTANFTYSGLDAPSDRPFKPLVKELMREVMGEHTCDKRSSRTVIHEAVPSWDIEPGFTEQDELWQADHRETDSEHDARTKTLLDDVFAHDGHTFISFTSHSGSIASLLRVVGHRQLKVPTGGLMPILLMATKEA